MNTAVTLHCDEIQGLLTALLKDMLELKDMFEECWDTLTINQGVSGGVNNYTFECVGGELRTYTLYGVRII